jgi:hypothetical protein
MGLEILNIEPSKRKYVINKKLSKRWKVIKFDTQKTQDESGKIQGTFYEIQLRYEDGDILNFSIYLGSYENFKVVEVCIEGKTDFARFFKKNEEEDVKKILETRYGDLLEAIKRDCNCTIL